MGNNSVHGSLKRKRKKSSESSKDSKAEGPNEVERAVETHGVMDFYDKRDAMAGDLMTNEDVLEGEDSEMEAYYRGKTILLTGASGFVGGILLEKILRAMDVNRIYVLFRGKKSQSLDTRLREYFAEEIFDQLRKEKRDFHKKVVVLEADLQAEGLGLTEHERRVLIEDVQVVFHVAATVKFDEPIDIAYDINCSGTEILLNMAEEMKNLESFVYVSTAYSNCHFKNIEEQFYDPIYTHTEIKQIIESCSNTELIVLNDKLIHPMANTYTLTKHANEHMCRLKLAKLPLVVVRPSIVMPVVDKPCTMWMKGMNGLVALYVAVGLGIMRTVYQSTNNTIDIVPGDIVINCLLAAGWDRGVRFVQEKGHVNNRNEINKEKKFDKNKNPNSEKTLAYYQDKDTSNEHETEERSPSRKADTYYEKFVDEYSNEFQDGSSVDEDIKKVDNTNFNPIYNMVSCVENPITLGRTTEIILSTNATSEEGCAKALWVVHHNPTNNKWLYLFYFYVYNLLPTLLFFVFLEKMSGKKAQLMKIYRKIFFLNTTVANFSINEWTFTNNNAQDLQARMCPTDKHKYSFSLKQVDWDSFFSNMPRCLARYGVMSYTSKHLYNTRLRYMHMVDSTVITIVKVLLGYLTYRLVRSLLSTYLRVYI